MRQWKRCVAVWIAAMLLICALPVSAFALEGYEVENCLVIATEPMGSSEHVEYYIGTEKQPPEKMVWVDGGMRGSKALSLNGVDQYLQIGQNQLRMAQMTFTTWINFRGAKDPAKPETAKWQRLFTIHGGENCYFTVTPHATDAAQTNADGILDGVYMEYLRGSEGEQASMKSFTGAVQGKSHFGLPQNEWHHLAVVVDNTDVKLYVDGNPVLEELFLMPIGQMFADVMIIGGGLWGDPLLNALVDDMFIFDKALNAQQIAALMQTGDTKAMKNPAAATKPDDTYIPTTVATTTASTVSTEQPADKPYAPFGLPVWGFGVCVGVLALLVLLTVIVNIYEIQRRNVQVVNVDTESEPAMLETDGQPDGEERFLTVEQREQEEQDKKEGGDGQ